MSFKRAAAELGVTPTAISHQIRLLERYCGHPLFFEAMNGLGTHVGRQQLVAAPGRLSLQSVTILMSPKPPGFAYKLEISDQPRGSQNERLSLDGQI